MARLQPFDLSRRSAILGSVAAGALLQFPGSAHANDLENLSTYAAQRAREIAGEKTIRLSMLVPTGSQANINPVVAAFTQQTGIEITVEQIAPEDINTHLILSAITSDTPYDIALPATFGIPDLADSGAIRVVTDFAEAHEPEGLRSGVLYDVGDTYDNEIYGFQTDGDTYVMFYNADLLNSPEEQKRYSDETGQELKIPDTWNELDRQMAFFHRPDEGLYGGALFRTSGYLAWEWWVRFHAKGIWPFADDMTPQIASDEGVEALEELIAASRHLVPEAQTLGLFGNWERFGRGDVYCNIGWGGTQKYLNGPESSMRGKLAFGPTPGGMIGNEILKTPYFNWGWNYVVTRASLNPEIAYLFALFASSPDVSTVSVRAQGGFFDPFRPEHYEDPGIREVYTDAFLDVQRQSLEASIPDLYLANQSEYFSVLDTWLALALNGDVEPRQALDRIVQEWTLITIKAGVENQVLRWSRLKEKYPASTAKFLRNL